MVKTCKRHRNINPVINYWFISLQTHGSSTICSGPLVMVDLTFLPTVEGQGCGTGLDGRTRILATDSECV